MAFIKSFSVVLMILFMSSLSVCAQSEESTKNLIGVGLKSYANNPKDFLKSFAYNLEYQRAINKHLSLQASLEYINYDVSNASFNIHLSGEQFRPIIGLNYFTRTVFSGLYFGIRGGVVFNNYKNEITQYNGNVLLDNGQRADLYAALQTGYMFNFFKNMPTNVCVGANGTFILSPQFYFGTSFHIGITQNFRF